MGNYFKVAVVFSSLLAALPASAKVFGVTADGTWDCTDMNDANVGTVVVADTSYAFIKLDGQVGPYGQLKQYGLAEQDMPAFLILDGYLKEEMAAVGMSLTGPRGNEHDLSGEHLLKVVVTEDNIMYCTRRKAPAP